MCLRGASLKSGAPVVLFFDFSYPPGLDPSQVQHLSVRTWLTPDFLWAWILAASKPGGMTVAGTPPPVG